MATFRTWSYQKPYKCHNSLIVMLDSNLTGVVESFFGTWVIVSEKVKKGDVSGSFVIRLKTEISKRINPVKDIYLSILYTGKH